MRGNDQVRDDVGGDRHRHRNITHVTSVRVQQRRAPSVFTRVRRAVSGARLGPREVSDNQHKLPEPRHNGESGLSILNTR